MKTLLLSLLAAALCLHTAYTLKCYLCSDQSSNSNCLNGDTCKGVNDAYCQTLVYTPKDESTSITGMSITKQCTSACISSESETDNLKLSTSCCKTDLCNVSGAISVKMSYLALVISAGFIGTLLRAGL